jgi:hypothetical protein
MTGKAPKDGLRALWHVRSCDASLLETLDDDQQGNWNDSGFFEA